jgi:hypothetical protein
MPKASLAAIAALVLTASAAAALALAPTASQAAPPAVASGVYDNTLLLAVDAGGRVSGYFDMSQAGPPQIDCIAYLRGRLAGAGGTVSASEPGLPEARPINGRIERTGAGMVRISLPQEPDGCGNIWSFANKDNPADFTLQHAEPWTSVRVVKADRAYFSASPGAAHGKAYVVKDDGVGVRAEQNGWVQADFVGEAHTSSGWLKESDLYAP